MQTYCSGCKKHTDNMCQKIKKKKKTWQIKKLKKNEYVMNVSLINCFW